MEGTQLIPTVKERENEVDYGPSVVVNTERMTSQRAIANIKRSWVLRRSQP